MSFNVNGIKSVCEAHGGTLASLLRAVGHPDVLCVQETKTSRTTLTQELATAPGCVDIDCATQNSF